MKFTVIDVETANADLSSICQIGCVSFSDGKIEKAWSTLVDPEDDFDGINVSIHGITESMVKGKPVFRDLVGRIEGFLCDTIAVSHTAFDRASLSAAYSRNEIELPSLTWLDTARVVRRTWLQFASSGYGLFETASFLGIDFDHHNAEEDARAAGEILLRAISESGHSLDDWMKRSRQPIGADGTNVITREANPDGLLYGEKAVFTGALSILRREVADIAAKAGCEVLGSVTKKTTLLVVGDQDITKLGGHAKSSKHRKAEELIAKGVSIRILRESDFNQMIETSNAIG